jgi:formyltetrahydrofolate deformylase
MKNSAILLISCPDRKGEVATIADFVFRHGGNILHADEHADEESGLFLMRVEFDPKDFDIDLSQKDVADFSAHFSPIAEAFHMKWRLAQSSQRPRMIILVSKYDHCLVDLLYRRSFPIMPTTRRLQTFTKFRMRWFRSPRTTRARPRQKFRR